MPATPPRRRPSEVSAGAVVARQSADGWEYALVRAKRNWGLPKGHLEERETPEAAALREVAEETGLPRETLAIRGEIVPSEYVYRDKRGRLVFKYVHQYVVVTTWTGELTRQEAEIDETGWFPLGSALTTASFAATRDALREAAALLADGASQGAA